MIICGVEEAGRGPVIGPLVMAGVTLEESSSGRLADLGVKDSKLLLPKRREELFDIILKNILEYKIIILSPRDVDEALLDPQNNLNWLEAQTSIKIINSLRCDKAILDCPSNNIKAYSEYVKERIEKKVDIVAEHKADVKYPVVSAASILAKVTRDREIEKIKRKYGVDFGSGYPSDPTTIEFLRENHSKYDFFRRTWASYKKVAGAKKQKTLGSF